MQHVEAVAEKIREGLVFHEVQAEKLRAALGALGENGQPPASTAKLEDTVVKSRPTRRRRGRPPGSQKGGSRLQQAVGAVEQNGPLTIPEIAQKLGITANYLYRVMPRTGLVKDEQNRWAKETA
jgi:hypothetical protein